MKIEEMNENIKIEHKEDGTHILRAYLPEMDEKSLENIYKSDEESKRDAENLIKGRFGGFKGERSEL